MRRSSILGSSNIDPTKMAIGVELIGVIGLVLICWGILGIVVSSVNLLSPKIHSLSNERLKEMREYMLGVLAVHMVILILGVILVIIPPVIKGIGKSIEHEWKMAERRLGYNYDANIDHQIAEIDRLLEVKEGDGSLSLKVNKCDGSGLLDSNRCLVPESNRCVLNSSN